MVRIPVRITQHKLLAALAAAGILVLFAAWLSADDADQAGGSSETFVVTRRAFASTVNALGAVKPRIGAEVRVGSRISGRVQRLRANVGDRVSKGQIIAELETADLDAVVAQRQAELRLAESRVRALEEVAPVEDARARAEVDAAEARAKLASDEWARQRSLLAQKVTTEAEAQSAAERHGVAEAQLESARRTLQATRAGLGAQRDQTAAERERARAALRSATVDRAFATITAPIAGIIASVATQEGETVAAGLSAPTFVTIVDLSRLQVHAFVDEVDIGKVETGQRITFAVDAFPARDFAGTVVAIYPSATIQDNVVKYVVAIDVADAREGELRPEMTASVRLHIDERTVLAIPARAIRRVDGRSVVYAVNGSRREPRPIRVGWRDGPWAEVAQGLSEGDRILVDPPVTNPDRQTR